MADDTDVPDDGNPCTTDGCSGGVMQFFPITCGAGLTCHGGACVSGCVIGGAFHAPGAANPGNPCEVCDPAASTGAWSNESGAACDDGNPCTTGDSCTNGVCVGSGSSCSPTSCQMIADCNGAGGACTLINKPDGTLCPDGSLLGTPDPNSPGVCVGGSCMYGCWVDGHYQPPNMDFLDASVCHGCDPHVSRTSFLAEGGSCHIGLVPGVCHVGVCHFDFGECPGSPCRTCSVQYCGSGLCYGYPKTNAPCADDANPCTSDACNDYGSCMHSPLPNGTTCGSSLVCMNGSCVP